MGKRIRPMLVKLSIAILLISITCLLYFGLVVCSMHEGNWWIFGEVACLFYLLCTVFIDLALLSVVWPDLFSTPPRLYTKKPGKPKLVLIKGA